MGKDSFRKICFDGRRRPVNKAIFESWCYVFKNISKEEVEILYSQKKQFRKKYMELCESAEYLYVLKAPDKKAVYTRIAFLEDLIYGMRGK